MDPTQTPAMNNSLLMRLDAIALALRDSGQACALLGLGSVGRERSRLDAYSDLDFFVIVDPGLKARYIQDLDWLAAAHPLDWHFQNTADGHKALMSDGVLCEFAVFEAHELARIPYAPGQLVWSREDFDQSLAAPRLPLPTTTLPDESWVVGEALSCLFVGMQRWCRGERLSAMRFVQGYALDRLIELDCVRNPSSAFAERDPFNPERRLEQRQPALGAELAQLCPGYDHTPAAALAMLCALERRGAVLNAPMVKRIHAMTERAMRAA